MSITRALALAFLAVAQLVVLLQWLAKSALYWGYTVPRRIHEQHKLDAADAALWRQHKCHPVATDDPPPVSADPLANTDSEEDPCTFCDHAKAAHEDDYLCVWPGCGCEAEQYPQARWRAGDPMQFRDRVVTDGEVTYEKVMA